MSQFSYVQTGPRNRLNFILFLVYMCSEAIRFAVFCGSLFISTYFICWIFGRFFFLSVHMARPNNIFVYVFGGKCRAQTHLASQQLSLCKHILFFFAFDWLPFGNEHNDFLFFFWEKSVIFFFYFVFQFLFFVQRCLVWHDFQNEIFY